MAKQKDGKEGNLPPQIHPEAAFDNTTRDMSAPTFDVQTRALPSERAGLKTAAQLLLTAGLGVAGYLTYSHMRLVYSKDVVDSLCNINAVFDCDKVNTSEYSELFGLPVALYAIPTYLVLIFLIQQSRKRMPDDEQAPLSMAFGISLLTGLVSIFLGSVSTFLIKAVCLFCISLYVVNLGTLGLVWAATRRSFGANISASLSSLSSHTGVVGRAALVFLVSFAVSFAAERGLKASMLKEADVAIRGAAANVSGQAGADAGAAPSGNPAALVDADDASYGPSDAAVTVVEFADFQCGYCKRMSYTIKALKEQYGDRVRFVFKHFPMSPSCNNAVKNDRHPFACLAAVAGQCANKQGKFWEFHDITFKNQRNLEREDLLAYAREVGLDEASFTACLSDPAMLQAVANDVEQSKAYQITGTPRIFINGKQFKGLVPQEILEAELSQQLGSPAAPAAVAAKAEVPVISPASAPAQVLISLQDRKFLIDAFEASRGPQDEAVSAFDKAPYHKVSWYAAKKACESAGKRLCTVEEWVSACQGKPAVDDDKNGQFGDDLIEGNEFSYSDFYEQGVCNDTQDDKTGKLAFTGSFSRCATPTGIFDMNGNVHEWVGATEAEAMLIGGQYYAKEKASCFQKNDTFGPGYANKATGFRCCQSR
ncbi:MAG: thioredoxin domain-containing protein [Myxococcota bacterium]